jgi:hypothetical protein
MTRYALTAAALAAAIMASGGLAMAASGRDGVMKHYEGLARQASASFAGFSAAKGEAFFAARHAGGEADTPSCTSCHTTSPFNAGQTRAGKPIEPLAPSKAAERYTDLAKVEKWFLRNYKSVLGRECSVQEKGDFLAFVIGK